MRNIIGVILIVVLYIKTADFIRYFPFELKLPAFLLMGLVSLVIAFFTNLTDKKSCRE